MFSATTHQVVKALGKDTLLPVPSLNTADNVEILSVLIKKRRTWLFFTRKPQYETTEFHLSDILVKPDDSDPRLKTLPTDSHVLTDYSSKTTFSLKGKFGADFAKEMLDVNLATTDSVIVNSQLGTLNKTEITVPKLLALLDKKKINIKHPIVSNARENKRKSLCIITAVVQLNGDGKISSSLNLDGSAEVDSKPIGVEGTAEVAEDKSKSMTIPQNTSIAFSMSELLISVKDGAFHLMMSSDDDGGFTSEDIDSTDGPAQLLQPKDLLDLLKTNDKRTEVLRSVQELLETPKYVKSLVELFEEVDVSVELNISRDYTLQDLKEDFNLELPHNWRPFLTCADFVFTDEMMSIPDKNSTMFNVCYLLLSLLDELDDDAVESIAQCLMTSVTTHNALCVLEKLVQAKKANLKMMKEDLQNLAATPVCSLMSALNITMKLESLDICVPDDSRLDLQATYYILDALLC